MRLFISHAFEDKDDFVRPLAVELTKHFYVWYDEFELKLGDNLSQKIDEGLSKADYGVVVLSPSFFEKKWPRSELGGLEAQETRSRKIIIPVWHRIDRDGVSAHSPRLADRFAANSKDGIARVVEQIQVAVGSADHMRSIVVPDQAEIAVRLMGAEVAGYHLDQTVLRSSAGVRLFEKSVDRMRSSIASRLNEIDEGSRSCFAIDSTTPGSAIRGPFGFQIVLLTQRVYDNSLVDAVLRCAVSRNTSTVAWRQEGEILDQIECKPSCASESEIRYLDINSEAAYSERQLIDRLLVLYASSLRAFVAQRRRSSS